MRKEKNTRASVWLKLFLAASLLAVAVAGCARYGGVEGVVDRARAKVSETRPHPDWVPTPFTAPNDAPLALPAAGSESGQAAGAVAPQPATGAEDAAQPTAPVLNTETAPAAPPTSPATEVPLPAAPIAVAPAVTPTEALHAATPVPAYRPAQPAVALSNLAHYWQGWNNCGPATLAMDLSYYGSKLDQNAIAPVLKPDKDDKNVSPDEMVAYAQSQGFHALARVNGDAERMKLLLSNGVPVIIETWMEPKPNDGMGHYRLLVGYDDAQREWIAYDSYDAHGVDPNKPYAGIRLPYDEVTALWHVFDNAYIVAYTEREAPVVSAILRTDMDDMAMWQRALAASQAEVSARPSDAYAWFNLGSELVAVGQPADAARAYDRARQLGLPWRMLWYQFGPFQAYYATGRHDEVIALVDATLKTAGNIEELYYWKGLSLQAKGQVADARQAWQRAVQLNKNYRPPAESLARITTGG